MVSLFMVGEDGHFLVYNVHCDCYVLFCFFFWTTFQFGAAHSRLIAYNSYSNIPVHCPLPATVWDERIFVDIIKAREHFD